MCGVKEPPVIHVAVEAKQVFRHRKLSVWLAQQSLLSPADGEVVVPASGDTMIELLFHFLAARGRKLAAESEVAAGLIAVDVRHDRHLNYHVAFLPHAGDADEGRQPAEVEQAIGTGRAAGVGDADRI